MLLKTKSLILAAVYTLLSLQLGTTGAQANSNERTVAKFQYVYGEDARMDYPVRLLRRALAISEPEFGPYRTQTVEMNFSRRREIQEIISGDRLNIIWASALDSLMEETLQVPIPILKGLGGQRVFLIRADDQKRFDQVRSLDDLKRFIAGQGAGWLDVDIFNYNDMRILTSPRYASLFKMLARGRFDYFPRGVNEVFSDLKSFKGQYPNLVIEKNLLLAYDKPVYFFVSKKYPEIADRLTFGLNAMIKTGEMDQMWQKHHGEALATLDFENRRVIKIPIPNQTEFVKN